MFDRSLTLPDAETFFLWGPRQTGKSTLLRRRYPSAPWIDLLKAEEFRRYTERPELLREEIANARFVIIDEVQKVPALLDEVHWLHENRSVRFGMCGSSARKVRRGHANLLGGRAVRYELFGLTKKEVGDEVPLDRMINVGYLPAIVTAARPVPLLSAYVADYLKEEVAAEGLVRNLPVFSSFLPMAALSDAELVNFSTIARDCGVSGPTIKAYFEILEDTLLGRWLPAYRTRPKRRVIGAPKWYFSDVGVVNFLAKRGELAPGAELYGKAFENWVFHELCAYNAYAERYAELSHWRLASGLEVDFIVDKMRVAVEAKASAKISADHLRGLRELAVDQPKIGRRVVVSLEAKRRRTEDGIDILPAAAFVSELWQGGVF
ncbi:MAG: ATP-binding protein [Deltaproteobacteria bacterium]|nr:ATP-binding protein [Deltaproteobacteria bacterium]